MGTRHALAGGHTALWLLVALLDSITQSSISLHRVIDDELLSLRPNQHRLVSMSLFFAARTLLPDFAAVIDDVVTTEVSAFREVADGVDEDDDEDGADEREHGERERDVTVAARPLPAILLVAATLPCTGRKRKSIMYMYMYIYVHVPVRIGTGTVYIYRYPMNNYTYSI